MITETGTIDDFKRCVLNRISTVKFACGRTLIPTFKGWDSSFVKGVYCQPPDYVNNGCGEDDCQVCNSKVALGDAMWRALKGAVQ